MSQLELIDILKNQVYVDTSDYQSEREVRNVLARLRKMGIMFVPSRKGKGIYVRADHASHQELSKYEHAQMSHWKSCYFENVLPMKKYMTDMTNIFLMGALEGIIE